MLNSINNILDTIFYPILQLNPTISIIILAIIIGLIFTLTNKIFVDQNVVRNIKKENKKLQEKINKARKEKDEKTIQKYMKQNLELSQKQFKLMIKPLLFASIFIIFLFPWINYNYQNTDYLIENGISTIKLNDIEYNLTISEYQKHIIPEYIILDNNKYKLNSNIILNQKEINIKYITKNNKDYFRIVKYEAKLPFKLPFIGDTVGWLGLYIIISLPTTIILRKLLGVE
jgi:uncharacterized membrane protein (DUF106 family)